LTGQSPQRAVGPTEEEEYYVHITSWDVLLDVSMQSLTASRVTWMYSPVD